MVFFCNKSKNAQGIEPGAFLDKTSASNFT